MEKTTDYKVLGSQIRIDNQAGSDGRAKRALDAVNEKVNSLKSSRPNLKDLDIAVLAALHMASEKITMEDDMRRLLSNMDQGIKSALDCVQAVQVQGKN